MATGAEALMQTAHAAGVEVCFANPGTTEMHLVAALDAVPGVRAILGLFEGVVTGAADGYGRMTRRPALTLLHLGPGFANGIANLHNARRAHTPIVNLIGDHASWHVAADAPLTSDIDSLASPVSAWVRTSKSAQALPGDLAEAVAASRAAPGGVSTLIVPSDCAWDEAAGPAKPIEPRGFESASASSLDAVAQALRSGEPALLLLGGRALDASGQRAAQRIASATGARMLMETFPARAERGGGLPFLDKLPYFPEQVLELLRGVSHLVLVEAPDPVSFFGYPGVPSRPVPDSCQVHRLATRDQNGGEALEALAEALSAPPLGAFELPPVERLDSALTAQSLGLLLAASQPEGAIVMDEAATSGRSHWVASASSPAHTHLALTGGAIGQGMPCATGAAVACPDRVVIALQADGSGMYTLQALWTQAREGLNVKTIICANREYRILKLELGRAGIAEPGPAARALTDLSPPQLDWVSMSRGLGVPAERADSSESFAKALGRALKSEGPYLVEALI